MAAKKKSKSVKKSVKAKQNKPTMKAKSAKKVAPKKAMKTASAKKIKSTSAPKLQSKPTSTPKATTNWDKHITPLDDRLIVAPEAMPTMTAGGIIIPGSVNDRPVRGKVLAKGRGRRNKKGQVRPLDVSVGDQIMYAEWSGTKIDVGGQEVLILREEDVLGIVT